MQVQVARIGKPHGIKGEVTVLVLTDAPESRFAVGAEFIVEPAKLGTLTVRSSRWNKDILLLGFEGTNTRNDAELLRGATLFFESDDDEDDDAWYEHELLDLEVRVGKTVVGKVAGLRTQAVQDLLIVKDADGDEVLVPFVDEIVPEVNIEEGYVLLTPPAGLFTVNKEPSENDESGEPADVPGAVIVDSEDGGDEAEGAGK
ncbi:16S rRNA processing protein RimM [Arthrobacter stackebrandtii]|uniref:Ribosome maturation factor RimM n=1 Tax=Arthrobacter stackebrandtii TaxID=272161 RepID=A0ABS4YZA6_9MICC|nr:ribosome maturation factor RimM [Arthrobacter stackebrandtii]MBP2414122.1 16S rRNA processing protein RimM [Arthrobacter stackebrandtii]PYG99338.1 ribosome maturation factor RimM [Arthrobacter stackebrandtii]